MDGKPRGVARRVTKIGRLSNCNAISCNAVRPTLIIIIRGVPGHLEVAEIDTAHFMGNFPESIELHALHDTALSAKDLPLVGWTEILPQTKVGPNRRHYFQLENVEGKAYTHVRVTIHPDGGLKRVRLVGKGADKPVQGAAVTVSDGMSDANENKPVDGANNGIEVVEGSSSTDTATPSAIIIPVLTLTPEPFAPFGKVIQAYADHNAAPRGTKITSANQGTANKFHKLALLSDCYPSEAGATTGLSVFRCSPVPHNGVNGEWEVKILERHPFTTQAFIPMGIVGQDRDGVGDPGNGYLIVVAKNGPNDKPDLNTLRAFAASSAQGIMYNTAIWRE